MASSDNDVQNNAWLDDLLEDVSRCVEAVSPMGPLGLRYHKDEEMWEVWIYPTPVELVGGAHDGAVVDPGFSLDLNQLDDAFDDVEDYGWNALDLNYPEGPHIYIEGTYQGHDVYLQVLAQAPDDEQPGLKVDMTRKRRRRKR